MWFKQIQIFQLTSAVSSSSAALAERLQELAFNPCLPTMRSSMGWISPIDEENMPLTRGVNGCIMICLQIEDKILPASVVTQSLKEKIKQMELAEDRKIRQKEKLSIKDDLIYTLLPRAFSKYSRIYAYIDTRHNWLVLNSISPSKTELFVSMFKKSLGDGIASIETIKPSSIFTTWLKDKDYPQQFAIEKSCVLQDPEQQNRVIRCQQQDLFAASIQTLVKEGCEAIQLALNWYDKIDFIMSQDFSLRGIRLSDNDLAEIQEEIETKIQKFDADFILMTEIFSGFIKDILSVFTKGKDSENFVKLAMVG